MTTVHIIWTLLLLGAFIAIVVWAFSSRRRAAFERAAHSVLDDEQDSSEHRHG